MSTHILVNFFISTSLGSFQNASASSCRTEIYINDPQATILVDDKKIDTNRPVVECAEYDQKIAIEAPGKKPFVRFIPAKSRFNQNEKFWNVQLENILEFPQLQGQRLPAAASKSEAQVKFVAPVISPATPVAKIIPEAKSDSETPMISNSKKNSVQKNNFFESLAFEVEKGIFIQIEAIAGFKSNPVSVKAIHAVSQKQAGVLGIKACPAQIAGRNQEWTKILVGPVKTKKEAQALAKFYGNKSFMIVNPLCLKNLIKTSQIEK